MEDPNKITYFGYTDARNKKVKFGIKAKDRLRHLYSIGKTGMGKSTLLENMAIQDIQNGEGMAFIDPHGKTADLLLDYIPEHRIKDVIYFAPFDTEYPIAFNVMEDVGPMKRHLVLAGLMSAFEKVFGEESFSDRMQYILQNTILALLEYPGATMLGINKMLSDKVYRNNVIANITDSSVKNYWTKEYASYTDKFAAEAIPAIQNKIGQFTSNPLIRNIIGQAKSSFDIRKIMDSKKILIVNLSKGLVGESNANLLGSMLVTKIYLAAMSRADASPTELARLPNFYLYVDEFQSFANKSFADILSEARKYKLSLNITHQYIEQMAEEVRAAVFGNVGTMICFRVGSFDAEVLEKEFAPVFTMEDMVNLGAYQMYLKLMIDNVASQPFSATGMPPIPSPDKSFTKEVLDSSRSSYAHPKVEVEDTINKWHENGAYQQKPQPQSQQPNSKPFVSNRQDVPRDVRPIDTKPVEPVFAKKEENIQNSKPEEPVFIKTGENNLGKAIEVAMKEAKIEPIKQEESFKQKDHFSSSSNQTSKQEEKISLQVLKHNDKNTNKGPSVENKNALRSALAEAIKNPPKIEDIKKEEKKEEKNEEKRFGQHANNNQNKIEQKDSKLVSEVPKEVLMKVLKGEN